MPFLAVLPSCILLCRLTRLGLHCIVLVKVKLFTFSGSPPLGTLLVKFTRSLVCSQLYTLYIGIIQTAVVTLYAIAEVPYYAYTC